MVGNGIVVMFFVFLDYRSVVMFRFIFGNCIDVMCGFFDCVVDFIVIDLFYFVGFKDC